MINEECEDEYEKDKFNEDLTPVETEREFQEEE